MTTNLLLVGVGPHTRLNHLPELAAGQDTGLVGTVTGIDLPAVAQQPVAYGPPSRPRLLPVIGVEPFPASRASLPAAVRAVLDEVVVRERIGAVIVATEPSMHVPYVLWALGVAAMSAARTNNTYLATKYRRIASRRGPIKAIVAVEHAMLIAIWNMITHGTCYHEPGADFSTRLNPDKAKNRALDQLRKMGYTVTLTPLEAAG